MIQGIWYSRLEVFRILLAQLRAMPAEHNVNCLASVIDVILSNVYIG